MFPFVAHSWNSSAISLVPSSDNSPRPEIAVFRHFLSLFSLLCTPARHKQLSLSLTPWVTLSLEISPFVPQTTRIHSMGSTVCPSLPREEINFNVGVGNKGHLYDIPTPDLAHVRRATAVTEWVSDPDSLRNGWLSWARTRVNFNASGERRASKGMGLSLALT